MNPDLPDPDGSEELLGILDGRPETYQVWANSYYELEPSLKLADVAQVYRHVPLTPQFVKSINSELDISVVRDDAKEIGYPFLLESS